MKPFTTSPFPIPAQNSGRWCWRYNTANLTNPASNYAAAVPRLISMSFTLDSHSSRADASRSRSAAHSSRTEDLWSSTDSFHSVNICVMESESECGSELEEDELLLLLEGDDDAGISESEDLWMIERRVMRIGLWELG
jgi:hypothetical protein